jgi:hypothetical protein
MHASLSQQHTENYSTTTELQIGSAAGVVCVLLLKHTEVCAHVVCIAAAGPVTAATLPGIERLTALKELWFACCDLEPSCLLHMSTGLTDLCLWDVTLNQRLQAQQGDASAASQLLQVLARLPALQELDLHGVSTDWPQQQLALYSALTASSNLSCRLLIAASQAQRGRTCSQPAASCSTFTCAP